MSKYSNFQSTSEINQRREENRKARQQILESAKNKYEIKQAKVEKAKRQGEGTWMLDSVNLRIQQEQKSVSKSKKKKKKEKKAKKKHKKKDFSSDSASSDDSEEESWVEKTDVPESMSSSTAVKGPQLQRDSWMESPLDLIPYISRKEIRDAANKEKEEARKQAEKMFEPGQHARELNPYWKNGGTGVPEIDKSKPSQGSFSLPSQTAGDGGLSWLRTAYKRCQQQAEDEGRSLEEVAAERWGSLKKLKSMLKKAEESQNEPRRDDRRNESQRSRGRDWGRDRDEEVRFKDRLTEDTRKRSRSRERYYNRESSFKSNQDNERAKDRAKMCSNDERERKRERVSNRRPAFKRPCSDSDSEQETYSKQKSSREGESRSHGSRRGFRKPGDTEDESSARRFVRPGDSLEQTSHSTDRMKCRDKKDYRRRDTNIRDDNTPRWKKKLPLKEDRFDERDKESDYMKSTTKMSKRRSPSSSDSSCSSVDSDEESTKDAELLENEPQTVQKVPSEEELNELAAKILRAEIMGDEDLVSDLKAKLENARKMRESAKGGNAPDFAYSRVSRTRENKEEEEDADVVVLSRTSKGGLVRPVLGSSESWGGGGRKQKKKNAATHSGSGDRTKFFDDDDNFDLKTLVEREKAGTAEDQNSMFARLAGRAGDRDLDVDDMFVSKAAQQQSAEHAQRKDRAAAIFEHRKVNAAMEKCQRCFNKVAKHLIIAIGTKSYLCLPPHRSLTEGHCFIVPMAHVSSATSMDEDVWQEMQLFRKTLVKMFAAQDQDVVIMETVMNLKHFPHTAIECVPLEREVGDLSPIYFKKAIQETGPEWSDNKKLHDLSKKDVRHLVPKGFPYFSVDFGLQGGFAHVIEDEAIFPHYFGREIVGGMLDAEPNLWRKPHKQNFEEQRQKVLQFEQMWAPHDWTKDLH